MPGRQSHGGASSKKPKVRAAKSKKRALDAFSIASHQNPDKIKIRQSRLGVSEGGNRPGKKRAREDDEEEDDEEESHSRKQRKGLAKGRFDELDVDEGSDSDGNNWKLGQVDSDDDSDLDSDEAFGESDKERFDGFTFGGSSNKKVTKKNSKPKDVNLDEDDEASGSELSDDSLGEEAIDLATMLDQTEGDSDEEPPSKTKEQRTKKPKPVEDNKGESEYGLSGGDESDIADGEDSERSDHTDLDVDESDSEEEADNSEEDSSMSSADDEENDPVNIAAMHEMINSLPQAPASKWSERQRNDGGTELKVPLSIAPGSKKKLVLEDFTESKKSESKGKSASKALEVPIAKRQQDRLDRTAAYDKTKETLDRWTDTVKHNRRAEHLIFPLPNDDVASAHANTRLPSTTQAKPFNELEATIQNILEESGLANSNGKDDEDHLRELEELETNKMSIEEVKARRDQLRIARELLFREEAKAKRIKKIKSKSYRKVHRKQREKEERQNKEALAEGGFLPSEDELEAQDRRRAEERMGAKHRGSKWAKATKETGRAAWDEDARAGITEMAKRDEELRKRVEGRSVREFEDGSDVFSTESDDGASEDDEKHLQRLEQFVNGGSIDESAPGGKLANMKFMLKAEASRRKENDAMVEEMRKELDGEQAVSEAEANDIGRRTFGPGSAKSKRKPPYVPREEFEEPVDSEDGEGNVEVEFHGFDNPHATASTPRSKKADRPSKFLQQAKSALIHDSSEGGAWSKVTSKSSMVTDAEARRRRQKKNNAVEVEELDLSKAAVIAAQPKLKKTAKKTTTTLDVGSEENTDDETAVRLPFAIRDQELIKRAFAGADVVGEFEAEKKQTIEDEEEKFIDNTLPGWGSWTGDGLSKKEKAKNKGRFLTKSEGIKEKNRKDAKLERVIMNEKRVKKNGKYLASSLPHPFETRAQYERSLRLPVGPEWATKETFQDATKPRVLLKQGIIAPMSKPLL